MADLPNVWILPILPPIEHLRRVVHPPGCLPKSGSRTAFTTRGRFRGLWTRNPCGIPDPTTTKGTSPMKRGLLVLTAALMLSGSTGCGCVRSFLCDTWDCFSPCGCCHDGCGSSCGGYDSCGGCGGCDSCVAGGPNSSSGGMMAGGGSVTYPYYTTRGPRDYLASNPRSIGR
jgi:hypothetical protein